ncbi:hypothetical protein PROFUN_03796 [Planoprotostelium fungivorum]|uniref:Protein kinase domain-containing protein n=1 Tax=Planoprotostelium fungivorum TaxID=1890364 RepID=A0A2P6NI81_9EUKA|nr:hypothetical protein PROFUN_03796 [Planoprotostelium fungivorum]
MSRSGTFTPFHQGLHYTHRRGIALTDITDLPGLLAQLTNLSGGFRCAYGVYDSTNGLISSGGDMRILVITTIIVSIFSCVRAQFTTYPVVYAALKDLYNSTDGSNWKNNTGWDTGDTNYCQGWYGVQCLIRPEISTALTFVTLYLDNNNLDGQLPGSLQTSAFYIPYFSMANNNLQGNIPDMFSFTTVGFNLTGNSLEGSLPSSLSQSTHLLTVQVGQNNLNGSLPLHVLVQSPGLMQLDLSHNQFTGEIPEIFQSFPSLKYIDLRTNLLVGPLPVSLSNLDLMYVDLSQNQLKGSIPSSWNNSINLQYLALSANTLTGEIPTFIGNWIHLNLLDLSSNLFSGTIPTEIEKLVDLKALRLNVNLLEGEVPRGVFQFGGLIEFSINNNNLTGEIGDLSQMKNLSVCLMSFNRFTGPFPTGADSLPGLLFLVLTSNQLSGSLPDTWQQNSLISLDASINQLNGPLPASFANLTGLRMLLLAHNGFTGGIDVLENMISLTTIDVSTNGFSGPLTPNIFGAMSHLVSFNLSTNRFSGMMVYNFSTLSPLRSIDVSGNSFRGLIPDTIHYLFRLQYANFSGNRLSGAGPVALGFLSELETFDFSDNRLSGAMPSVAGLNKLKVARFDRNQFSGEFPETFNQLTQLTEISASGNRLTLSNFSVLTALDRLETLNLSHNLISGSLLDGMRNMKSLRTVDLSYNNITGSLSGLLGIPAIQTLILNDNKLSGGIGPSFCDPQIINLKNNQLSGDISFMGSLSSIERLDLSMNDFSGPIPALHIQNKLTYLNLTGNHLTSLPSDVSRLTSLKYFDVSYNDLQGSAPDFSSNFGLMSLQLQYNNLTNATNMGVPSSVMCNLENNHLECPVNSYSFFKCQAQCTVRDQSSQQVQLTVSVPRDEKLLNDIALQLNISANRLSYISTEETFKLNIAPPGVRDVNQGSANYTAAQLTRSTSISGISSVEWPIVPKKGLSNSAIAGIVIGTILFVLILTGVGVYIFITLRKRSRRERQREMMLQMLDQLLINDVTVEGIIGQGNFGKVYKGDWNGTPVAIKGVKNVDDFQDNQFKEEIKLLQKLNHPNVVRLLGVHLMEDSSLNMVLEFAENGSLCDFLRRSRDQLPTETLLFMVLDLINGMLYLQSKSIIHRDLATRNLLLDGAMNCKISDFGLSREENVYNGKSSAIPYRWAAPEVMQDRISTLQSDVWSFGVVVWEIFAGARVPYQILTNKEVFEQNKVLNGTRLEQPDLCPPAVWDLVLDCWMKNPSQRPTFERIRSRFTTLFEDRLRDRRNKHTLVIESAMEANKPYENNYIEMQDQQTSTKSIQYPHMTNIETQVEQYNPYGSAYSFAPT